MKKIISLVLTVCILFTMVYAVSITASAATPVIETIKADLQKSQVIMDKDSGVQVFSKTDLKNGAIRANVATGDSSPFGKDGVLWLKAYMSLNTADGEFIRISEGYKYVINVTYTVTTVNANPSIAIIYNNGDNKLQDNGSNVVAHATQTATGRFVLSAVVEGVKNRPLRLAFGGNGKIAVEAVEIERVALDTDVKNVNYVVDGLTQKGIATDTLKTP